MHFFFFLFLIACNDGDLILLDGATEMEGRIEICINNSYGSICNNRWDVLDATVACKQLEFSSISKISDYQILE